MLKQSTAGVGAATRSDRDHRLRASAAAAFRRSASAKLTSGRPVCAPSAECSSPRGGPATALQGRPFRVADNAIEARCADDELVRGCADLARVPRRARYCPIANARSAPAPQ
jgi:hypothetical protein